MSHEAGEQSQTANPGKTAVLIVGMHRSGTSAMARIASLCGAMLPARLMPPNLDNEAGFWEPVRIADFNDDLLHRLGLSWDDIRETDLSLLGGSERADLEERLAGYIEEDFADASQIVLKEPRISRFLPLYQRALQALGYRVVVVVMFRNPLAVIASLKARNGFDDAYAAQLWQRYVVESEAGTRELPRIFVDFEALLRDWRPVVAGVSSALELGWESSIETGAGAIDEFLKIDSRHHVFADDDLEARSDLDPELAHSVEAMRLFESNSQSLEAAPLLDQVAARISTISHEFAPIFMPELVRRSTAATKHADALQNAVAETASLAAQLAALRDAHHGLSAERDRAQSDAERDRLLAANLQETLAAERDRAQADAERDRLLAANLQETLAAERDRAQADAERDRLLAANLQETLAAERSRTQADVERGRLLALDLQETLTAERGQTQADAERGRLLALDLQETLTAERGQTQADAERGRLLALDLQETLTAERGRTQADAERGRLLALDLEETLAAERGQTQADGERGRRLALDLQNALDHSQGEIRVAAALNAAFEARRQPEIDAAVLRCLDAAEARHQTELCLARAATDALRAKADGLEAERASVTERYNGIVRSSSWRVTRPVRAAMRLLKGDWREVRGPVAVETQKVAMAFLRLFRVPTGRHRAMTTRIYSRFGGLFRGTAHFELWQKRREAERASAEAERMDGRPADDLVERARRIRLASSSKPLVSVLIPTYAQVGMTLACLESIASHLPSMPCEFIVVDDASGDPDLVALDEVDGIRFFRNPTNLGFLRSCNAAAKHARGDHILFLNNDTLVTPGWVDRLVDIFASRPDAGLAGSKLVYPDGRLQEAGGIVWSDASAWNFGHGDDPNLSGYNYVREVDYVSGAALMVRRDVFERLGGFDELYVPAYYEDCDLAFRARAIGFKTYYQPTSVVVHFEGASHGRDVTTGVKAHQLVNQQRIFERWRPILESQHYRNGEHVFKARERTLGHRTILIVDHYVPQPDRDAGSKLMLQYIEVLLSAGWLVKFWPDNLNYDPVYTPGLQQMGVEVLYGQEHNSFERWIAENGAHIDCALLSRPHIAPPYVGPLRQHSKARIVYCGIDLHAVRMRMENSVGPGTHPQERIDHFDANERWLWASADVSIYPAEEEAAVVRALSPGAAASGVSPYYYDDFEHGAPESLPSRRDILFVGGFGHTPNVDAAGWLVEDIMPLVWRSHPEVRLHLVGSNPTERVRGLASDMVNVTGWVSEDDLTAHYRRARVAVVPLRFGAGVKSKVTESLRFGLPLVTTPVGAQGLPGLADVARVRDSDMEIAAEIVSLLGDDDAWRDQSSHAVAYASTRFTRAVMTEELLGAVGAAPTRSIDPSAQAGDMSGPYGRNSLQGEGDESVAPLRFFTKELHGLTPEAVRSEADNLLLPHLSAFIDSIGSLQDMLGSGNRRRYLQELIERREFTIVSPKTGAPLVSGHSTVLNDKTIFFSFPDDPTMALITGDLARGMPICGALLADRGLVLKLFETDWGISQEKIDAISGIMQSSDWNPAPPTGPLTLLLGDFNFAHYAWNQLSTLDDLLGLQLPPDIRFVATAQPLGSINALFPELANVPLTFVPDAKLQSMNRGSTLFAALGGARIGRGVIDRVMRYARENTSDAFRLMDSALRAHDGPTLWMSVRTTNRTAVNQHDVLTMLAYCFLKYHQGGAVVIDGFSLADDIEAYPSYNRDPFERFVADDLQAAEAIKFDVDRLLGRSSAVHIAVGLRVPESVLLAEHATIYFSHHGTVQHKIGWFHATPGMVHCNLAVLANSPSQWVADQSEIAIPPRYIAALLIDEHDEPSKASSPFGSLLNHQNYRFADIKGVLDAFFAYSNETRRMPTVDMTDLDDYFASFYNSLASREIG